MKVNNVCSTNFGAGIRINSAENKSCQFLYNKVNSLTYEFKIPATFHTHEIELPTVSKAVLEKLKSFGIKFSNK